MSLTVPGCNFRCSFCPYKELIFDYIPMEKTGLEDLVSMLRPRLGFLDGVSIEGGEPFLHREFIDFLKELRFHGSLIKVKTNASKPTRVQYVIEKHLVDYFSVFIPAPISRFKEIVNQRVKIDDIIKTVQIIRKSNVDHEFVVKPVPGVHDDASMLEIAGFLAGSRRMVIERYDSSCTLDPELSGNAPFSEKELLHIRELMAPYFSETVLF